MTAMNRGRWLLVIGALALIVAASWVSAVQAAPRAQGGRPPLMTATPTGAPTAVAPAPREVTSGIRLWAAGAPDTAWTVMQWQDGLGGWHDVDGWRGEFDPDGFKTWWFPRPHFGTGPFRWQVFTRRDGPLWRTSQPFDLPDGPDQMLMVEIR